MSPRRISDPFERMSEMVAIEDIPSIVASDLYAQGAPRGRLLRTWALGGDATLRVSARPEEKRATCSLTLQFGPDVRRVTRIVAVSWTRVGHASRRAWLHCGAGGCGRRVNRLYLVADKLVCRTCAGIRYESKNRQPHLRSRLRADKLRARLGGESGYGRPIPESKPKGMHWSTFRRLRADLLDEEERFAELIRPYLQRELEWAQRVLVRSEVAHRGWRPPRQQVEDLLLARRPEPIFSDEPAFDLPDLSFEEATARLREILKRKRDAQQSDD